MEALWKLSTRGQFVAAQLNLILRREGIDAHRWVTEAGGGRQHGE